VKWVVAALVQHLPEHHQLLDPHQKHLVKQRLQLEELLRRQHQKQLLKLADLRYLLNK
jgi:hypothetical protein